MCNQGQQSSSSSRADADVVVKQLVQVFCSGFVHVFNRAAEGGGQFGWCLGLLGIIQSNAWLHASLMGTVEVLANLESQLTPDEVITKRKPDPCSARPL